MKKIYLDVCCLNRPFDDQTQDRIRMEAEAILLILKNFEAGKWQWIGSEVLDFEIEQTPDLERRWRVKMILTHIYHSVSIEQEQIKRAQQLEALGFKSFDAFHIACAESGGVGIFLTTDDQLFRLASRFSEQIHIKVENPLTWIKEVIGQ